MIKMVSNKLASALNEVGYNGDIKTENIENTIYEATKNKTRVVITGTEKRNEITAVILHVLQFHGIETDFITEENYSNAQLSTENDFVIIEAIPNEFFGNLRANIALITDIPNENSEIYSDFIAKITSGGVLVYNKKMLVNEFSRKFSELFQKIPLQKPNISTKNDTIALETELGNISLNTQDLALVHQLEGARYICQQLGLLEEDFYEAVMNF
jgi:UDP-N-acetylmuramate: L-alanyl-gamma-D-glutamyl-meso-diaminopimelate ligase